MRNTKSNIVNHMRLKIAAPAFMAALFALPAMADHQYTDTARVLSVSPQTERVNVPRQECRTEYQQQSYSHDHQNSITGAVIGGIAGGLLGNTVGRGNGRVAATAIGAGVGAIAGDRIANNRNSNVTTRTVPVETCYQVDNWQTVNAGYYVTYEYHGRTYSTVTSEHPGQYISVNVAVSPNSRVVSQVNYIAPESGGRNQWRNHHDDRRGHGKHHRYY
ncbi:MAG: glycine zipper 2TM domain-containing protein [Methylotenera sp.]|nr:glycine zipper 2TM domain-containing protein [Methylotenera sp.]PKO47592.1 MAG: hypothetical protein CVU29_01745 [Betaproteobacteria bacterium HGW-Betaproteobacteria-22]